jgi:hypothetical protein
MYGKQARETFFYLGQSPHAPTQGRVGGSEFYARMIWDITRRAGVGPLPVLLHELKAACKDLVGSRVL